MRLILSQYLKSLKERDEFDALLPDLLLAMGYVSISLPQGGIRQYGVDLAVSRELEGGSGELLLFVIKQGDVGRKEWNSDSLQGIRQSIDDVFDSYLEKFVEPIHNKYVKKVILATTGEKKQELDLTWSGYVQGYADKADIEFWGGDGDKVAYLIEKHLLNENIFKDEDRKDLRKALALAGEVNYDQKDLHRLFLRQLGLAQNGELSDQKMCDKELIKGVRITSLAAQVFARWSEDEGNSKQALIASERALLWSWHRIQLHKKNKKKLNLEFSQVFRSYFRIADEYHKKIQGHLHVRDALSGYSRENASVALNVFEQIGLVSSIGLAHLMIGAVNEAEMNNAKVIADDLVAMLRNNPVSGSPRLDENVVDISLGLLLLVTTDNVDAAKDWLVELFKRVDFALKSGRNFPICSDSLDDLVELTVHNDEALAKRLMEMSWMLPTLAGWAVLLNHEELYNAIAKNTKTQYPEICLQLWHPTEDLGEHLYFQNACRHTGASEAPVILPEAMDDYREQMKELLDLSQFNVFKLSPGFNAGLGMIDLIAFRHFRTPVPSFLCSVSSGLKGTKDEKKDNDSK